MKKEIGKYLLDISKILFGTTLLGSFLNENISKPIVAVIGSISFVLLLIFGFVFQKKKKK